MGIFKKFKKAFEKKEPPKPINGSISIENKIIKVTNPINGGISAKLSVHDEENIKVLINGEKLVGETEVKEEDLIELTVIEEVQKKPSYDLEIKISSDKMDVLVKKKIEYGEKLAIQDVKNVLTHKLERTKVKTVPKKLEKEEIIELIEKENYQGKLIEENIKKICETDDTIEDIVMKGIEPIEGQAAYFELVYEIKEINFISQNELIAIFHEEIPSIPGKNVVGEDKITEVKSVLPALDNSVSFENGEIRSQKDGRLIFSEKEIKVVPQLIIPRDLNASDGHVYYEEGDILIKGAVLEGSFIRASGIVQVEKGIHDATIIAEHGVFSKGNIEKTKIFSGWTKMAIQKMNKLSKKSIRDINLLLPFCEEDEFEDNAVERRKEITSIIERTKEKNTENEEALFELISTHGGEQLVTSYMKFTSIMEQLSHDLNLKNIQPKMMRQFQYHIKKLENFILENENVNEMESAKVNADSITSSDIYSSGEVVVSGAGVYMSNIESDEKITIRERVKGGVLIAEKEVLIGNSYKSFNVIDFGIYVKNPKGVIKIGKRYPDTLLSVGGIRDISYETRENVTFSGK
jgi:hypothetical protein